MSTYSYKNIKLIWISFLTIILLLSFFNGVITNYDTMGFVFVVVHVILTFVLLVLIPIKEAGIFAGAFAARFMFMLWDLYAQNIFILPNSGADTEFYYNWGVLVSEDLGYLTESIRGGLYSKILGLVFYLTGPMRILSQYLNVLLGLMTVVVIHKILVELKVNKKTTKNVLLFAAFFPNSLIMSAILLREIIPTFLVAVSLLFFIRWYNYQRINSFLIAFIWLGLASMFHSGVVAISLGYLFMFLFYSHKRLRFEISFRNILMFVPVLAFVFLFATQFGDMMFYKFRSLEELGGIYESVRSGMGGSAYLVGMTINNPLQFVIYAPVRAFYFLFSPLPMNWRGGIDIITFFIDSLFYFFVIFYFFRNRKWFKENKQLIIILLITIIVVALVFGIGVNNSGTAMRHRQKIIPLFLIFLAVMKNEKLKTLKLTKKTKLGRLITNE